MKSMSAIAIALCLTGRAWADDAHNRCAAPNPHIGAAVTMPDDDAVHLGPDELLVAAKIAVSSQADGADIATTIDDAEARVRDILPSARIIYLEPDIYRPTPR